MAKTFSLRVLMEEREILVGDMDQSTAAPEGFLTLKLGAVVTRDGWNSRPGLVVSVPLTDIKAVVHEGAEFGEFRGHWFDEQGDPKI